MNRYRYIIFSIITLLLLTTPVLVSAQGDGLVSCGVSSDPMAATGCNFCYLAQLIQNVVNFLVMVTIPISVAMFAWAGIMFFTSAANPKRITQAKKIFSSVFIGFMIAIFGWLGVQVILQTITSSNYSPSSFVNLSNCEQYNTYRPRDIRVTDILNGSTLVPGGTVPGGTNPGVPGTPGNPGTTDLAAIQRAINSSAITAACQNNPSVDCSLLQATCVVESNCSQVGCNSAGACGPMQIKPDTACGMGLAIEGGCSGGRVTNVSVVQNALQDPNFSARMAAEILANASSACDGRLECMTAYYNGGPGATTPSACCSTGARWQCQWDCGTPTPGAFQCDTANPRPSQCVQNVGYQETRNYYQKIIYAQSVIWAFRAPTGPGSGSPGPF